MPITSSAKKALRTAERRRDRNYVQRSVVKTRISALEEALASGDAAKVAAARSQAMSAIDRALKRGVIPRNTAARRKAALARTIKLGGKAATAAANKPVRAKKAKTA